MCDDACVSRKQEPASFLLPAVAGNSSRETSSQTGNFVSPTNPTRLALQNGKCATFSFLIAVTARDAGSLKQVSEVFARAISDPGWWVRR